MSEIHNNMYVSQLPRPAHILSTFVAHTVRAACHSALRATALCSRLRCAHLLCAALSCCADCHVLLHCCQVLLPTPNPKLTCFDIVLLLVCTSHAPLAYLGMVKNIKTMPWPMPFAKGLTNLPHHKSLMPSST
ncbi:unnamed protein product [Prunus armeniaca]